MKDTYIRIRLSDKDKETIRNAAERGQMTMTDYLIYLVRRDNDKDRD